MPNSFPNVSQKSDCFQPFPSTRTNNGEFVLTVRLTTDQSPAPGFAQMAFWGSPARPDSGTSGHCSCSAWTKICPNFHEVLVVSWMFTFNCHRQFTHLTDDPIFSTSWFSLSTIVLHQRDSIACWFSLTSLNPVYTFEVWTAAICQFYCVLIIIKLITTLRVIPTGISDIII